MYPFITFFGHTFSSYGLMAALGFISVILFGIFIARQYSLSFNDMLYLTVFSFIFLVLGAKLFYLLTVLPTAITYVKDLWEDPVFYFNQVLGGMVFYGGLIGAFAGAILYARFFRQDIRTILMLLVPAIPLFHFWGRIGCFLAGCCHGIACRFGIAYSHSLVAENHIPYLPTQLMEAAFNLMLFVLLLGIRKKNPRLYTPLGLYLALYGIFRFVIEFFRGDEIRGHILTLSISQWISLVIVPFGIYCIFSGTDRNILNRLLNGSGNTSEKVS